MIATINGVEFTLHDGMPFGYTDPLTLFIESDSADFIVETIGDGATVVIPDEYTGTDLQLQYIRRTWDRGISVCETVFKPIPVREMIKQQGDDIEVTAQAIEELASIIG